MKELTIRSLKFVTAALGATLAFSAPAQEHKPASPPVVIVTYTEALAVSLEKVQPETKQE